MVVRSRGLVMTMIMVMVMGMTMVVAVPMGMPMCVIVKAVPVSVIVRHGASLAPSGRKSAPLKCLRNRTQDRQQQTGGQKHAHHKQAGVLDGAAVNHHGR